MAKQPNSIVNDISDFEANKYVRVADHIQQIGDIKDRIKFLEDKFGSNEKIAETLSETAQKAIQMQTMLASTFLSLLQKDHSVRHEISRMIDSEDRKYGIAYLKRFGLSIMGGILFITGSIVGAFINHIFTK